MINDMEDEAQWMDGRIENKFNSPLGVEPDEMGSDD